MPYCQNCGSQIPAETRFCANCGSAVTNQASSKPINLPINLSYSAVSQDAAAIRNKQKKNNKTAIIASLDNAEAAFKEKSGTIIK